MTATPSTVTVRRARRRFEPGMIVLDPNVDEADVIVWTCARVTTRATTLQADYGAEQAEARLTGPDSAFIPDGWKVLEHDAIALVFAKPGGEVSAGERARADEAIAAQEPPVSADEDEAMRDLEARSTAGIPNEDYGTA